MKVIEAGPDDPRVARMIALQKAYSVANTPPGSGHAVIAGTKDAGALRYFLAVEGEEAVGSIALKILGSGEGEIKTMHVLPEHRGRGIAGLLLERLMDEARSEGLTRLKLETGPDEAWAASRRVYERAGFRPCEKWGAYVADPYSYCMSREMS